MLSGTESMMKISGTIGGSNMTEMYIKYNPDTIGQYLKEYYIQFIYCGMVLLRKRAAR